MGGYPVRIKITNPDHSALVGIGSNSGGLESAWVSTSSLAAEQGHRLADRHTHTERKTQMFSHCRIGTLAAPAIAKCQCGKYYLLSQRKK